jgi:hypothetical protein
LHFLKYFFFILVTPNVSPRPYYGMSLDTGLDATLASPNNLSGRLDLSTISEDSVVCYRDYCSYYCSYYCYHYCSYQHYGYYDYDYDYCYFYFYYYYYYYSYYYHYYYHYYCYF